MQNPLNAVSADMWTETDRPVSFRQFSSIFRFQNSSRRPSRVSKFDDVQIVTNLNGLRMESVLI